MPLVKPTIENLWSITRSVWKSYRPTASLAPRSDAWLFSYINAKQWARLHDTAFLLLRAVFPNTSYEEYLDAWAEWVGVPDNAAAGDFDTQGYGRIQPRAASGGSLRVGFDAGASVAIGDQLTDAGLNVYQVTENYTQGGSPGTHDVGVDAITTGSQTNLEAADSPTLTFVSPPAGVDSEATLVSDLDGGADRETDADLKARVLVYLRRPSLSGTSTQIRRVIEALDPANLRPWIYPKRQGFPYGWGTVDILVTQVGEYGVDRAITADQETAIDTAIRLGLPAQQWLNYRLLDLTLEYHAIKATYTLEAGVSDDLHKTWNDGELDAVVTAGGWDDVNLRITTDKDVTSHLVVGSPVVINGSLSYVTSVGQPSNPTDNQFQVDEDFSSSQHNDWPYQDWRAGYDGEGAAVCSGGGLMSRMLQAVRDYYNGLGPARDAAVGGSAADEYDNQWVSDFRPLALKTALAAAAADDGVTVVEVTTDPDAVYGPTDDTTQDSVPMLHPEPLDILEDFT